MEEKVTIPQASHAARAHHQELVPVLVVEDDAMVRGWVELALRDSEFAPAGIATTAAEALDLAARRRFDLLLIDFRLPDAPGTDLVRELRRRGIGARIILMTANPERGFNELARGAGAEGTVLKTGRHEEFLRALRLMAEGEAHFDPRHPQRGAGATALSPREREVLKLVAGGRTNREIARMLGVGSETVKTLLARTYDKLGARRRAEAVSAAHEMGLL